MRVVLSPEARSYALAYGAELWVRTRGPRRCNRGLAIVEVSTDQWDPSGLDRRLEQDGIVVHFRPRPGLPPPDELTVELRGGPGGTLRAYWDGCRYAI